MVVLNKIITRNVSTQEMSSKFGTDYFAPILSESDQYLEKGNKNSKLDEKLEFYRFLMKPRDVFLDKNFPI